MTDVEKIQLQQWWMEQIREITRKVMKEEEKRREKANKKAEKLLSEYESRDDIMDAFGMGMITEKETNKLLDLWDQIDVAASPMYSAKLELLEEFYADAHQVMRDLGQEV